MQAIKRLLRWTFTLAVLAGLGAGFLAWEGRLPLARGKTTEAEEEEKGGGSASAEPHAAKRPAEIAVTTAAVVGRPVQRAVQVVGTLYGYEEIEVATKVDGRVARIRHDVGDVVRPGEVLLEVDDTDYRLLLAESRRALELDMARLGLREVPDEKFDVRGLPAVVRAELLEKNARNKVERSQALARRQALSKEDAEQTQNDFEVAQANTRQALLDAEWSLASVRQREALYETAQQKLRDAKLVVPTPSVRAKQPASAKTSGKASAEPAQAEYVVAARLVSEGEMVHAAAATPLFRLVMDRPLKLMARVPERYVAEVRVGQPVELSVEAYLDETFAGTVARVNPTIDRTNRTFDIEIRIPNDDRRLHAGSFAKAAVLTRKQEDVPTIPEEALVKFAGVVKVFVVREGIAHAVPVESGVRLEVVDEARTHNWLEAVGPLHAGDVVVTAGHSQLAEGTPVRIREPAAPRVESARRAANGSAR